MVPIGQMPMQCPIGVPPPGMGPHGPQPIGHPAHYIIPQQPVVFPIGQRLLNLAISTGYDIIQENGQRKLGPPPRYVGPPPPKGSEVFIGKLPKDMYEDNLFPLFNAVGTIYEVTILLFIIVLLRLTNDTQYFHKILNYFVK